MPHLSAPSVLGKIIERDVIIDGTIFGREGLVLFEVFWFHNKNSHHTVLADITELIQEGHSKMELFCIMPRLDLPKHLETKAHVGLLLKLEAYEKIGV